MMNLDEHPHRRYNPLTDEWVLCSPHRTKRPWQGQVEGEQSERLPEYDHSCYLCPGNERAKGARNPAYASTYVFDNDFPALLPAGGDGDHVGDGLLIARAETGICRVICFSPRHDLTLARMEQPAVRQVVETWAEQAADLGNRPEIGYVQIFENRGAVMGCSNPHPHCQVWATGSVPTIPARKLASQAAYLASHGTDLLGDYLDLELRREERLVCRNEHWAALVPFWAVWPYETMLIPARRAADLSSLAAEEREALAEIVRRLTTRYDNLFRTPFPYSMGWHSRPVDGGEHPGWRLHAVYYPPLLRSATVRKFMVGYELCAEPQRDITPEQAAARLREMGERHYLEK